MIEEGMDKKNNPRLQKIYDKLQDPMKNELTLERNNIARNLHSI